MMIDTKKLRESNHSPIHYDRQQLIDLLCDELDQARALADRLGKILRRA